jgi:manganese/zinc/iron transport system substrate-binding protein
MIRCLPLFLLLVGSAGARPLEVVATTMMVADMAREIGGDRVKVHGLMGPGVDPHLYRATPGDLIRLQTADLILVSGLRLEGRMGDSLERLAKRGRRVVAVTDAIPRELLMPLDGAAGYYDPHVWFDPELWSHAAGAVAKALADLDPAGAEAYQAAAERTKAELAELHEWSRRRLAAVPEVQRTLVTSHDAFGYFGRAYDFEVVAVQGISTATEAGLARVAQLTDRIRQRGLKAIFVESSVSPAAIQRISRDSGARVGGELYSDAAGKPGDLRSRGGETYDVGTYRGMVKSNINTIAEALE